MLGDVFFLLYRTLRLFSVIFDDPFRFSILVRMFDGGVSSVATAPGHIQSENDYDSRHGINNEGVEVSGPI